MSIRPATDDDHDALRQLWGDYHRELAPPGWWDESWDEAWTELQHGIAGALVLVAELDGAVVGYAVAGQRRPRAVHLHDIYVRPEARKQGVAKTLLRGVASTARERGAEVLTLNVDTVNTNARAVYRRLGFSERAIGLIADIAALEQRTALSEKPASVASTHAQTDDESGVDRALAQFLPRLGRSAHTDVIPPRNGWVTVVDELCDRDRGAQRRLGAELSDRLGVPVVALALEEDAVVRFLLFERGRMVDEYLSVPTYYGELTKADELSLAANPTLVARLTGADPKRVRAVARTASSPAELPPARELLAQVAEVMNIEARIER